MDYITPLAKLIEGFQKFQGIGAKSAQRLAFQMLSWNKEDIQGFAEVLNEAAEGIDFCPECFNFSTKDQICNICKDHKRDKSKICVVPTVRELIAIERTRHYKGKYHVLQGLLSPLDGIGPDDLKISELLKRLQNNSEIQEIVLALNPSTEGEATALYLYRLIKPSVPKISRLAFGLSVGSDIEQTDELTLAKAFDGRQELSN